MLRALRGLRARHRCLREGGEAARIPESGAGGPQHGSEQGRLLPFAEARPLGRAGGPDRACERRPLDDEAVRQGLREARLARETYGLGQESGQPHAAKHAGLSNLGTHIQSIEPSPWIVSSPPSP